MLSRTQARRARCGRCGFGRTNFGSQNMGVSNMWAVQSDVLLLFIVCKTKSCKQIMHTNVLHRVTHKTISLPYIYIHVYEQHTCNFVYSDSRKALASGAPPQTHCWKYFDTRLHDWPHQLFTECAGPGTIVTYRSKHLI